MRQQEAQWIELAFQRHLPAVAPGMQPVAINLGSGTRSMRESGKPYVNALTIRPLETAGYRVLHSDLYPGDGIDVAGDMFDASLQRKLRALDPRLVMFCNVIEHVPRRLINEVPAAIDAILAPGGLVLFAAPFSYPYHADPIDNLFRPNPQAIIDMFPGYEVVAAETIDGGSYAEEFRRGGPGRRLRKLARLLFPLPRPRRWASHAHRMLWLARRYQHAMVLLRKPAAGLMAGGR